MSLQIKVWTNIVSERIMSKVWCYSLLKPTTKVKTKRGHRQKMGTHSIRAANTKTMQAITQASIAVRPSAWWHKSKYMIIKRNLVSSLPAVNLSGWCWRCWWGQGRWWWAASSYQESPGDGEWWWWFWWWWPDGQYPSTRHYLALRNILVQSGLLTSGLTRKEIQLTTTKSPEGR